MSKRYSIFLTVLFCAFLGCFAVLHWALPDRLFSPNENRNLQTLPTPKVSGSSANLLNRVFMTDFEDYYTDQFPLRDTFISMKAACETALGKTENNDVFFGSEDTLFAQVSAPDSKHQPDTLVGYVDTLAEHLQALEVPVYFSLVPNKLNLMSDRLLDPPLIAPFWDGQPLALSLNYLGEDLWARAAQTEANWVDLMPVFQAHGDEELFYRTDHHWTSLGAYYAYAALMEAMNQTPVPLSDLERTTVSDSFYGTTWSSAGAPPLEPDQIDAYVSEEGVTVTVYKDGTVGEPASLYDPEKLAVKDKYSYFLGGNQPLYILEKENSGPKVLVIRDSYADSLAPFLTLNCSEVHLLDPRYNKSSIPQYVEEHDIDQVIVLYSMANFITDSNLFLLGI